MFSKVRAVVHTYNRFESGLDFVVQFTVNFGTNTGGSVNYSKLRSVKTHQINCQYVSWQLGAQGSVGKPEGKRPLGRPRRRWEDNIKLDLHEVGGGCGYWMELAQDRDR